MEDIFSIIIVLLIYAVAVGSAKKSSAKRKAGKQKRSERKPQFEHAFEQSPAEGEQISLRDVQEEMRRAAASISAAPVSAQAERREADCETSRLHLHEVTQDELQAAAEGEDPCHGGHAPQIAMAEPFPEEEREPDELSRDVLRGVIMSEILTRPCERRKRSIYGR